MTFWQRLCIPALAVLALTIVPMTVHADTQNEAILGGVLVHTVRTSWAGLSPDQRASIVQERLNRALSQGPIYPSSFSVGQVQGDWCVLFRGHRFVTADAATAKQDNSNPEALAKAWAVHLRHILPPLTRPTG